MKHSAMRQLLRIERAFLGSAYAETYTAAENAAHADECARAMSNAWTKMLEDHQRQWEERTRAYERHAVEMAEHLARAAGDMLPGARVRIS